MKFRPCIDLHSGQVKQIVGSTLTDEAGKKKKKDKDTQQQQQQQQQQQEQQGSNAAAAAAAAAAADEDDEREEDKEEEPATNFATDRPAADYARMYEKDGLTGGHVIMLGPGNTEAAKSALAAYPQGLQVGGGINTTNALEWLDAGASHVIVTSFVFHNGQIDMDRLSALVALTGKDRLVLDLSCRRKPDDPSNARSNAEGPYYVVTDRWQTYTDVKVDATTLANLGQYCDEFLVHGVENEGKRCGILEDLVVLLGQHSPVPVTYAGGVKDMSDLDRVRELGRGRVDLTIGSALDCFGGDIPYDAVVRWHKADNVKE